MKLLKKLLIFIFISYFLLNITVYFFQEKLIFFPIKIEWNTIDIIDDFGNNFVKIKVGKKNFIYGKYIDNNSKKIVLFFHGNGGNINHLKSYEKLFEELRLNVLFFDYRGYGRSSGKIKYEEDLFDDSLVVYKFLKKNGFEDKDIILWGHSLGGAVAVDFSKTLNKDGIKFNSLVVDSSFDSMLSMANKKYPFILNKLLLKYKFESEEKINAIQSKILFIHGKNDKVISYTQSKKMYDIFLGEKKYLLTKGSHNSSLFQDDYIQNKESIKDFLNLRNNYKK